MDNLSRLINKYSNRFGEQDFLVLNLKQELAKLQLNQDRLVFSRPFAFQFDQTDQEENYKKES